MHIDIKHTLVVGNQFSTYASVENAITASKLISLLDDDDGTHFSDCRHYIPGQGLTIEQRLRISSAANVKGLAPWFSEWLDHSENPRADQEITHKHLPQNVLITEPVRISSDTYGVNIDIDGRNEYLGDHSTGLHIQGMVLMEACRQTFLAVTERFYLRLYKDRSYFFVIDEFSTLFKRFAFASKLSIQCKVVEADTTIATKLRFMMVMSVIQDGVCVTEVSVRFAAFESVALTKRERSLAVACVGRV